MEGIHASVRLGEDPKVCLLIVSVREDGAPRRVPRRRRAALLVPRLRERDDALPKRLQPRAKGLLNESIEAPARTDAKQALEVFREEYGAKYPKALAVTRTTPTTTR